MWSLDPAECRPYFGAVDSFCSILQLWFYMFWYYLFEKFFLVVANPDEGQQKAVSLVPKALDKKRDFRALPAWFVRFI